MNLCDLWLMSSSGLVFFALVITIIEKYTQSTDFDARVVCNINILAGLTLANLVPQQLVA